MTGIWGWLTADGPGEAAAFIFAVLATIGGAVWVGTRMFATRDSLHGVKDDIHGVKDDIHGVKDDIHGVKNDMQAGFARVDKGNLTITGKLTVLEGQYDTLSGQQAELSVKVSDLQETLASFLDEQIDAKLAEVVAQQDAKRTESEQRLLAAINALGTPDDRP